MLHSHPTAEHPRRLWKCDVCGTLGEWNDPDSDWMSWGPVEELDDEPRIMHTCSDACRERVDLEAARALAKKRKIDPAEAIAILLGVIPEKKMRARVSLKYKRPTVPPEVKAHLDAIKKWIRSVGPMPADDEVRDSCTNWAKHLESELADLYTYSQGFGARNTA